MRTSFARGNEGTTALERTARVLGDKESTITDDDTQIDIQNQSDTVQKDSEGSSNFSV